MVLGGEGGREGGREGCVAPNGEFMFFLSTLSSFLPSLPSSLPRSTAQTLHTSIDSRRGREGGREGGRKGGAYLHCSVSRVEPVEELLVSEHDKGLEKVFIEGVDASPNAWAREGGREGYSAWASLQTRSAREGAKAPLPT